MNKFLLVLFVVFIKSATAKLPSVIKVCSRNDPNIDACIKNSLESLRQNLASGNFGENFNVPKIEPLYFESIKMQRGQEFQAAFSRLNIFGCSGFELEKLHADPKNLTFDIQVLLPKLNFTGKYSLKMKILLLNLAGKGDIKGQLTKSRANLRVRGYTETIDGEDFVRFHRMSIKLKIDDGKFQLSNLFNGDPVLGQVGNQVINDNARLFIDELTPGLEKNLSKIFSEIINNILKDSTHNDMFPDKV
uniref:Putative hemolymph juvenile hormone binding protein n=1 Tax=Corethrella appendiculata TaxID=1370023 RepID=U5EUS5_9DIPT